MKVWINYIIMLLKNKKVLRKVSTILNILYHYNLRDFGDFHGKN
jgi:hypothetical protein